MNMYQLLLSSLMLYGQHCCAAQPQSEIPCATPIAQTLFSVVEMYQQDNEWVLGINPIYCVSTKDNLEILQIAKSAVQRKKEQLAGQLCDFTGAAYRALVDDLRQEHVISVMLDTYIEKIKTELDIVD